MSVFIFRAEASESVASVRAIEAPNSLIFASRINSTDGFGSEILVQGLDALFGTMGLYAAHYSTQRGSFTNFFSEISDPTSSSRFHYAPDAIYRIGGNTFDRIDRETGIITSRTNPFGNPGQVEGLGDVLVAITPTSLTGYRLSSEETVYTINPDTINASEEFLRESNLPALIAYALGVGSSNASESPDRSLQLNPAQDGFKLRLKTPRQLPANIRLEIFESTNLTDDWECIGVKTGAEPWYLMRRGAILPVSGDALDQVELNLDPSVSPEAFYYLRATEL